MKRVWLIFAVFCLTIFFASGAFALDILEQDPTMGTYVAGVYENLILVFDASLDPATVTDQNVKVIYAGSGTALPVSLSLVTTNLADDTVVIDPVNKLPFGIPLEFSISPNLTDMSANGFSGVYPFGAKFVANIPDDLNLPDYSDPSNTDALVAAANALLGFYPLDPENTDESEYWKIPGMFVTEAWKKTIGRPDVLVAIIDDGLETYDDEEIRTRLFINTGELPLPDVEGTPCAEYDCNEDGRINIEDYELDSRLLAHTGGALPSVYDMLQVFSDSVDDDGNGFVDDISGWDFFRDVNEVLGVDEFPEGTHGGGRAAEIGGVANDGQGRLPGICSDCMVLPLRVSDAVIADYNMVAAGIRYADNMGSSVAAAALGSFNYNEEAHQAVVDAFDHGMLIFAASGDEFGFHHLYPGAGEDVFTIKSIFPFPPMDLLSVFPLELIAFTESYCTNYGAHIHATAPAGHICTSEATGLVTGIAALVVSRAKDLGLDLSAAELTGILTASADDIYNRCLTVLTEGGCQRGFDEHYGYGRINAKRALELLGDPDNGIDHKIPPAVRMTSPRWWQPINPMVTPTITIQGQISARAPSFHYQIEFAQGVEPLDNEFQILDEGDSNAPLDGNLFTISLKDLVPPAELRRTAEKANDKTVTFRLRAYWRDGVEKIWGEQRKAVSFFIDDDPRTGSVPGFPIDLGASGEGSVTLYDMADDPNGYLEIVFATSDGWVWVYQFDADVQQWGPMDGFPVDVSGDNDHVLHSVIATPAVGDLFGDGRAQIVVATTGGRVYAIWGDGNNHAGGALLPGFPMEADDVPNDSPLAFGHGNAFLASPVIADLDLDGTLEIIAAGYDQKAYAWKVDDGTGQAGRMSGWPVLLSSKPEDGLVPHNKRCGGDPLPAQVLGAPAVFIIDPENENEDIGMHPSVVVGTTETCEGSLLPDSRVYAVYWNGMDNADGPFLPDWPAKVLSPLGDAIPIPPLTIGVTNAPAAAYLNGETLISVGGFFWFPSLLKYEGEQLKNIGLPSQVNFGLSAHGTFAPLTEEGGLQFILPTLGALNKLDGKVYPTSFNIAVWDVNNGDPELILRKKMDDILFFVNPTTADLDNDGNQEILAGSGGFLVRGFNIEGKETDSFPKTTGHWIISSPAVADVDRDGMLEVVTITHDGYLFAWESQGEACVDESVNGSWPTYRHDEHNTGLLGFDATPPARVIDLDARVDEEGRFNLHMTATGDDHLCGMPEFYDVRYSTNADDDLTDPEVFANAQMASVSKANLLPGGTPQVLHVDADDSAEVFAVRAVDDAGRIGPISNLSTVTPENQDDDDDSTDDDTTDDDDEDDLPEPKIDDGEDIGCGCD